jgi:hypothetical protein
MSPPAKILRAEEFVGKSLPKNSFCAQSLAGSNPREVWPVGRIRAQKLLCWA